MTGITTMNLRMSLDGRIVDVFAEVTVTCNQAQETGQFAPEIGEGIEVTDFIAEDEMGEELVGRSRRAVRYELERVADDRREELIERALGLVAA